MNSQTVYLESHSCAGTSDETVLRDLVEQHTADTGSPVGQALLDDWKNAIHRFTKVFPKEFKKVIREAIVDHTRTSDHVAGRILANFEQLLNPIPERRNTDERPGWTKSVRTMAKQLNIQKQKYNLQRGEKQTSFMLDEPLTIRMKKDLQMQDQASLAALGLGDVGVELSDVMDDIEAGTSTFTNSLRRSYLLWRKGIKGKSRESQTKTLGKVISNMSVLDQKLK